MNWWMVFWAMAAAAIYGMIIYNRLMALRQERNNAFADIDLQLKRGHDLISVMIAMDKSSAAKELEADLARAVNAADVNQKIAAEKDLSAALLQLNSSLEHYPELTTNQEFIRVQAELADTRNKITAPARLFNNITMEYNTLIQQFPAKMIVRFTGFAPEPLFESN